MPKFPTVTFKQLEKFIIGVGFVQSRSRGSHFRYIHTNGRQTTIPYAKKTLAIGTVRAILKQCNLKPEQLVAFLEKK